jgi:hypothetical protein
MATRKYKRKNNKNRISKKRRNLRIKKGGCGCGSKLTSGGMGLNISNDPQNPTSIISERLAGDFSRSTGGRKRNKKLKKGGMNVFNSAYSGIMNSGSNMNAYTSFGAVNGAGIQTQTVSGLGGSVISSNSAMNQPVLSQPYGYQNPPLV